MMDYALACYSLLLHTSSSSPSSHFLFQSKEWEDQELMHHQIRETILGTLPRVSFHSPCMDAQLHAKLHVLMHSLNTHMGKKTRDQPTILSNLNISMKLMHVRFT